MPLESTISEEIYEADPKNIEAREKESQKNLRVKGKQYKRKPRSDEEPEWKENQMEDAWGDHDDIQRESAESECDDPEELKIRRQMRNRVPMMSKKYSKFFNFEREKLELSKIKTELEARLRGKDFEKQREVFMTFCTELAVASQKYLDENPQVLYEESPHYNPNLAFISDHINVFLLPLLHRLYEKARKDFQKPINRLLFMHDARRLADLFVQGRTLVPYGSYQEDQTGIPSFVFPPDQFSRKALNVNLLWSIREMSGTDLLNYQAKTAGELCRLYKSAEDFPGTFSILAASYCMSRCVNAEAFLCTINELEANGVPMSKIIINHQNQFARVIIQYWENIEALPTKKEAHELLKLAPFVRDAFLRQTLSAAALARTLEGKEPLDKLTFLLKESSTFDFGVVNTIVETELTSQEQFKQCRGKLEKKISAFIADPPVEAGVGAIVSTMHVSGTEGIEVARLMLKTAEDVEPLRREIQQQLKTYSSQADSPVDDKKEEEEELSAFELEKKELDVYAERADDLLQNLFNITRAGKSIIVRKILTGKGGVLEDVHYREPFLRMLTESVLASSEPTPLSTVIDETITALATSDEWKPLFFALTPLLTERMLVPPRNESGERQILQLPGVRVSEDEPWNASLFWRIESEAKIVELLERMDVFESSSRQEKLSSIEFITEIAQHTGALGVRFLQLLPQFVQLSDQDRDAFSRVYDDVYGQMKLNAAYVLEREWPGFWNEIENLNNRIGGGSLMTTYRVKTREGNEEVVKVLNPNALFHLENTKLFITKIIDTLAATNPAKYGVGKFVLDEVSTWIERDITFSDFLDKDATFKATHDGFKPEGFNYQIQIPESKAPASRYFIREVYIEGKNLTQWEDLEKDGHNMKEIVSLLARSAVSQIEQGQIHSDMHPGNFRVTPDKKVAILDRNFYLSLNAEGQQFITNLPLPFISLEEKLDQFFVICNVTPSSETRDAIAESLEIAVASASSGNWSGFMDLLVTMRTQNLKLPLEITLLFKNMNVLQGLAHRAGFSSVVEAYLYNPEAVL